MFACVSSSSLLNVTGTDCLPRNQKTAVPVRNEILCVAQIGRIDDHVKGTIRTPDEHRRCTKSVNISCPPLPAAAGRSSRPFGTRSQIVILHIRAHAQEGVLAACTAATFTFFLAISGCQAPSQAHHPEHLSPFPAPTHPSAVGPSLAAKLGGTCPSASTSPPRRPYWTCAAAFLVLAGRSA
jgi:hypothetical protein